MSLNIESAEVEQLVGEIARLTGESQTEAIRQALLERHHRIQIQESKIAKRGTLLKYLQKEVWPKVPPDQLGRGMTR